MTLKFKQQVKVSEMGGAASSAIAQHLESQASQPFIVTTHENQWAAAEGALFENTLFDEHMSVSWPMLANAFQLLYLRATRQETAKPKRPLALEDLAYVHQKLGGRATIERSVWKDFWKWLEESLRKIRFAKHLCDMWLQGDIAGFINRTDTERLLADQPPGTFLVRLSDTSAGHFVISYSVDEAANNGGSGNAGSAADASTSSTVAGNKRIKHYLVTKDDTSTKKSLAEFMRNNPRLVYVLQVSVTTTNGKRAVSRVIKDKALKQFYGKEAGTQIPMHYDN